MNCLQNMGRITLDANMIMELIEVYRYNGKDFYYKDVFIDDSDLISKQIIELECFSLSQILGLKITDNRLKQIVKKSAVAKNHDEQLIINLKKTFEKLHLGIKEFEYTVNSVSDLAKYLFKDICDMQYAVIQDSGKRGLTGEKKPIKKINVFEEYLNLFKEKLKSNEYEITLLIVNFYVDYINIAPFKENNELIGLILLYILLFKEGFSVFRYASFFEGLYNNHESFKNGVLQANFNWSEGYSQTMPLQRIMLKIVLNLYISVDDKVRDYLFDSELNKSDTIENTINKLPELFTKEELRLQHPYVSDSTINRTLQRLRDENRIRPLGVGRSAKWQKLYSNNKFDIGKQLKLFEEED